VTALRAAFFGDYPHQLAGAAKSLLAAVVHARDHGQLDPVIVLPAEGIVAEACREKDLEVHVLQGSSAYDAFGKGLLKLSLPEQAGIFVREIVPYARAFARLLDRERLEVVHFNTARGTVLAGLGASLAGLASVLHVRGTPRYSSRYWALAQALSDRLILVARALESDLLPSVRPRGRVVYDGIASRPPLPRDAARAELVRSGLVEKDVFERGPVFTSLSSFVPFKGLHHLARASARLRETGTQAMFLLAGAQADSTYEAWLKREVRELGVADCVRFLGFLREPHVLLSAADALVLPSVEREDLRLDAITVRVDGNEGLPHSILEAMMVGIPSIASDVAGVREEIDDGDTGFVVPPGDPIALAGAIERLARDPARRLEMGARCNVVARARFPIAGASSGLVEVLREARDGGALRVSLGHAWTTFLDAVRTQFPLSSPE